MIKFYHKNVTLSYYINCFSKKNFHRD